MITNLEKITIAKDFISQHKINNVNEWHPLMVFGDDKLIIIYDNLENDVYGESRIIDRNEYKTEMEIEISSSDSISGHSVLFTWTHEFDFRE